MALLSSVGDFFALDIGTTAIRLVHLRGSGASKNLVKYAERPIGGKISRSDSEADKKALSENVAQLISDAGISTRNVVLGIPSREMFGTVIDLPNLSDSELGKTITYQAEQHIPMSLDEAQIDWGKLGPSPQDPEKVEVLLISVAKSFAERKVDTLEQMGLNVIAIEPDAMALSRALLPPGGDNNGATMILDIGDRATDLVITYGAGPRLIRGIPTGGASFIKAAMQNLNIDEKQAKQFVYKFGMNENKLEGQVYKALEGTVDQLMNEVEKSIKFFSTRYKEVPIQKIIVAGGASTLPEFPLYLANKLGVKVEIGNAWQNVSYPNNMYNELISISNHFAVAVGLAERRQ